VSGVLSAFHHRRDKDRVFVVALDGFESSLVVSFHFVNFLRSQCYQIYEIKFSTELDKTSDPGARLTTRSKLTTSISSG
jgi:hypothetical protein